ncbi:MAG: hypothetical protein ABSE53_10990 [Terracidiphilus sp.]|jgi:hypothetical protein
MKDRETTKYSRRTFLAFGLSALAARSSVGSQTAAAQQHPYPGEWKSRVPAHCPIPVSRKFRGLYFTGRHQQYANADTWYPSWASDDVQYSSFADGYVLDATGNKVAAACDQGFNATTGFAKIVGDDPLQLEVTALGNWKSSGMPYGGRYPCANLVHDGLWYYGTYCCDINYRKTGSVVYNWAWLGPYLGCRYSRDFGKTWVESPCTAWAPLFSQDIHGAAEKLHALEHTKKEFNGDSPGSDIGSLIPNVGLPQLGVMHFVDFGKNMQHSPDGKAYFVGHGAAPDVPHPRLGAVSWLSGDAIYLTRVALSPGTVNDSNHYEFFAGYDAAGDPQWSRRFEDLKPMLEWRDHLGSVTITYNPALDRFLMCVADGWPSTQTISTLILEADKVTGPWRLVCYLKDFGAQGYFVNIPSKFIQADGRTMWLCYSANFTNDWLHTHYPIDPPGSRYGMCLQEIKLLS